MNQPDGSGFHAGALGTRLRRWQRSRLPLHVRSGELLATVAANKLFLSSKHKIPFSAQNKHEGAQKHRASIAISKRKAQTSVTHPSEKQRSWDNLYNQKEWNDSAVHAYRRRPTARIPPIVDFWNFSGSCFSEKWAVAQHNIFISSAELLPPFFS